jgi:hypothetical protein
MRNLANDVSQGWDLLMVKDILNDGQFIIPSYYWINFLINAKSFIDLGYSFFKWPPLSQMGKISDVKKRLNFEALDPIGILLRACAIKNFIAGIETIS